MVREVGGEWRFDLVIWLFVGYKMEYCVEEGLEWVFWWFIRLYREELTWGQCLGL